MVLTVFLTSLDGTIVRPFLCPRYARKSKCLRSIGRDSTTAHRLPIQRAARRDMGCSSMYVPFETPRLFPTLTLNRYAHADGAHAGHRPTSERGPAQSTLPHLRDLLRGRVGPLWWGTRISLFIFGGRLSLYQAPNINVLIVGRAIAGIGSSGYALLQLWVLTR